MKEANRDVFAASGGMISLVFIVIGWFIYGAGPTVADSPDTILEFFVSSHDNVIWSMFVQGLGVLSMIWFMAALTTFLRDAGETVMAYAMAISFAVALALGSTATIMRSGIAFVSAAEATAGTVATIFYLGSVLDTGQNMISAGFFFAFAIAVLRSGCLPAGWGWLSVIAGLYAVASTTALNQTGFWSPHGAGFLNLVFYVIWLGGVSFLLVKRIRQGGG
jgi:hypothetical protein